MAIHIPVKYPIHRVPDQSDPTLVLSWLNKKTDGGKDYSVNENDGTPVDVVFGGSEGIGGTFNGSSSRLSTGSLFAVRNTLTFFAWIKTNELQANNIMAIWFDNSVKAALRLNADGTISWIVDTQTGPAVTVTSTKTIDIGEWHLVSGTLNGSLMTLFVDGDSEGTDNTDGGNVGGSNFRVSTDGLTSMGTYWDGDVADVRVYTEAKSANWEKNEFRKAVPDESLCLYIPKGDRDYSRFRSDIISSGAIVGNNIEVNGVSSYVDIDDSLNIISSDTVGAISLWVKPTDATPASTASILGYGDTNANEIFAIFNQTSGKLRAICTDAGTNAWIIETDSAVFQDNVWKHIAVVQDGVQPILYVNREAPAQSNIIDTDLTKWFNDLTGLDNGRIGCRNSNSLGNVNFFGGEIEEVRIFNEDKLVNWIEREYDRMEKFFI
jgi:hypothetical protein